MKEEVLREEFLRTARILGHDAVEKLSGAHVAVFGVGGVGSFAVEALARAGVGRLTLIDSDSVSLSNINRQLIALHSTVGQPKVEAAARRIADINPACEVTAIERFFSEETLGEFDFGAFDYIADAIDAVPQKLLLIETATSRRIPIISSMGMGNKLHPEMIELADIGKTSVCPLARAVRLGLRRRNIHHLKCVYSKELPQPPRDADNCTEGERQAPGSISFVPSAAGLIMAGEIVRTLAGVD